MTTIRPNLYPQPQAHPQGQDSGKLAAQRAFFDALSQARAPTQATAATATTVATQAAAPAPAPRAPSTTGTTEQPQKILRPGSLFDIRV